MPLILPGNVASATAGAYEVANSANFESANSQALSKDYSGTHSDANQGTWSMWIKRAKLTTRMKIFGAYISGNDSGQNLEFQADDTMRYRAGSGSSDINTTTAVYRDPSAWYHIVIQQDSDASGASNQVKIWVNNTLQTLSTNNGAPGLIQFGHADAAANSIIGAEESAGNSTYFDGYMAEFAYCDGQKLDPTSFGEYDEDSPTIWKPKDLSGLTFGNQGVWLDFEDSGTMGNDVSGNNNDFSTEDNAVEQKTDSPTNNFATLNPLHFGTGSVSNMPLSEGNLEANSSEGGSPYPYYFSTIAVATGKWYAEFKVTSASGSMIGIGDGTPADYLGDGANDEAYFSDGNLYTGNSSFGSALSDDDILQVAVDLTNSKIYFGINGTYQNSGDPTSGATGTGAASIGTSATGFWHFAVGDSSSGTPTIQCNFGNPVAALSSAVADADGYGAFEFAPPSGYYALNTKNLGAYGG